MRLGNALLLLLGSAIFSAYANDSAAEDPVAKSLEDTIFRVVETGLTSVDIMPVDNVQFDVQKCSVTSSVTCVVTSTGKDCEDLVVPIEQCRDIDMTFTYRYCSNEEQRTVQLFPDKTTALMNTLTVNGLNYSALSPKECREISTTRTIDTCKRFFSASLKVEGKRGEDFENGDYCYGWDFLRVFIKRPCKITSQVASCVVERTQETCDSLIVPIDECTTTEPMTFTFEYCNEELTPLKFRRQKFRALVETQNVAGFDLSDLDPGQCRNFPVTRDISTCKRFFSSSLKVEGWRGDSSGDYCYAYDFERIFFPRPGDPPPIPGGDDSACDVSSSVKCTITGTGEDCDDIVVPRNECNPQTDMTFEFEYCNFEESNSVNLFGGRKTIALVETLPIDGLDLSLLAPGECRTFRINRKINTCKRFFSASLKVEGRRGDGRDDYCYAYDFYRSYIDRPAITGGDDGVSGTEECDISAKVTCTVDETGEECDDIVVPRNECRIDVPMTFTFEYCSREDENSIDLKPGFTRARVETIDLPGLNFNDLQPGECRRLIVSRKINTCKRFFSAQLKVEGVRNEIGGYCYAWDFYRSYIARFSNNDSPTPANPSQDLDNMAPCAVSARVTCTLDATSQACEDIVVPLDECSENTLMTFTFEWCNFEVSDYWYIYENRTHALIETIPVDNLNLSNMTAGSCRRRIVTRPINTCKRFFSAQLKVQGLRGGRNNDYCYAYDFYRTNIARFDRDLTSQPTPALQPSPAQGPSTKCEISAKVSCTVDATGESCDDLEVAFDDCSVATPMTFQFQYCNVEQFSFIDLFEDNRTEALIETISVDDIDKTNMNPGECRTFSERRLINTCKRYFSASLKVQGLRNGTPNDYCYDYDFYRSFIQRPPGITKSPSFRATNVPSISMTPSAAPSTCIVSLAERESRIRTIINDISDPNAFLDPNSPQSRARDWLIFQDTYDVFCANACSRSGDPASAGVYQRYSLAVFYFSMNGDTDWMMCGRNSVDQCIPRLTNINNDVVPTFADNEIWLSGVSECLWGGLACKTETRCLDRIEFEANNVNGVIPSEIAQLNGLRYLYLEGAFGDLDYADGTMKFVTGTIPPEISQLSNLLILDLNYNKLQGTLPIGIYNMVQLRQLDLNHNEFVGQISPSIGNLVNLRFLQLDNNNFSGNIPVEIANLVDLGKSITPVIILLYCHCYVYIVSHNNFSLSSYFQSLLISIETTSLESYLQKYVVYSLPDSV